MNGKNEDSGEVRVVYSSTEIKDRISRLARDIARSDVDDLLVVAILKGSFIFAADLIRALHGAGLAPQVDFISLSSYGRGKSSSGAVKILRDVDVDVAGRDVLLVDDILESGRTLHFAKTLLAERGAGRIRTCVLLDKPVARAVQIGADFRAFECPDVFVVGYGMDLAYRYRELPFVGYIVQSE